MTRSTALAQLATVRTGLEPFGAVNFRAPSTLTLDGVPVVWVNASNALVVHAGLLAGQPAVTFPKEGSESTIVSLVLVRFAAGRRAA